MISANKYQRNEKNKFSTNLRTLSLQQQSLDIHHKEWLILKTTALIFIHIQIFIEYSVIFKILSLASTKPKNKLE